jgi:hypothetical protein
MLRLQCLWNIVVWFISSHRRLLVISITINSPALSLSFRLWSYSFLSRTHVHSFSLSLLFFSVFFCSYRKRAQSKRTNEREESRWMSSVYAYIRVACMSKERRHCYCCCFCYNSYFSSYNNYRISSLMYLLACWYSLPESTSTSIQPDILYYFD